MFPFTYEQKLSQQDTQQLIDTQGFKALFTKKLAMRDKNLTGIAYRDGKGGVTPGLTTITSARHWDLVLANPLDATRQKNGFKQLTTRKMRCTLNYLIFFWS
jgi:hypothetical protein